MRYILIFWIVIFFELSLAETSACFSPEENCAEKLSNFISEAKKSVDVAIYDINEEKIVNQITVQAKKIHVRVVCDERQSKGKHSAIKTLIKEGVPIRYGMQKGIMHDKFLIVDGLKMETGSFNYTHHASMSNRENQIYTDDMPIIKKYTQTFEKIWSTGKPVK